MSGEVSLSETRRCLGGQPGAWRLAVGPHNDEMQPTERGFLVGAPAGFVRRRPAIFIESRSAADLRCSTDASGIIGARASMMAIVDRRHL